MGNLQPMERSEPYQISKFSFANRNRERTDEGPQLDASSLVHDSYFTSLMTQTANENWKFWGSEVEDMDIDPISSSPWMTPMNINVNVRAEPLLKSPEAQWSTPPFLNKEKMETPSKSKTTSIDIADEGREDKTDRRNRMENHLIIKAPTFTWPPKFGFSSDNFRKESPLYPPGMISVDKHMTELPIICSNENQITYQQELEDMGTRWVTPIGNQTLKAVDRSATNQGRSLAASNSPTLEASPNVMPSPNNVFNQLDGSQTNGKTNKSHPLSTQRALKNTRGHYVTEPSINNFGLQDKEAEKMVQEASVTRKKKTRPTEDGLMNMPQPLLCTVQKKVDDEAQIKLNMPFSYADALKGPKIAKPKGALSKNEKLVEDQTTTHKATTKETSWRSSARQNHPQVNSRNPRTESSKKTTKYWKPTEPSTPPFKVTKAQLKYQLTSPRDNPNEHIQFKGSCNMRKPQAIKPNNTLNSGSTSIASKNTSTRNGAEYANPDILYLYQSYQIERRNNSKLVCKKSPTCMPKKSVKHKIIISFQPEDTSPQTPEATLPVKPPEENSTSDVMLVKTDQIMKSSAPEKLPKIKSATPQLKLLCYCPEEHIDTSDLGNSCPPVLREMTECPKSKDQCLVVLENEPISQTTTGPQVLDNNVGMEKNDPEEASKQPPGRWKAFYVDNHCTMKCRCRHRPGKLPPNVLRWLSMSQNKLAEQTGETTLKASSSFVAGTKTLLDHHSPQGAETSGKAPDKHPE